MAPSMMETIVMRKCNVPLKKAKTIIKEAKENIDLKRACLWSKEWEQECLRINQSEKAHLEKELARKAQDEASARRLRHSQKVKAVPYSRSVRTPVCGGCIISETEDETQHSRHRHRTVSRDSSKERERHHSISHSEINRGKSDQSSRQPVDDLIGMNVGRQKLEERRGHKEKTPNSQREKESSTSSSSKKKLCDEAMEPFDTTEKKHHSRSRSKARSDDHSLIGLDDRSSVRRSKSRSQSSSRRSHTLHEDAERPSDRSENRRDTSRSRRYLSTESDDETCQHVRHHRSVSRHRGTDELRSCSDEDDRFSMPSRRSTMAVASRSIQESSRGEETTHQISLHQGGPIARQRSKSRRRETEQPDERSRSKSRGDSLDRSGHTTKSRERSLERSRSKSRTERHNQNGHIAQSGERPVRSVERSRSRSRQESPDRYVNSNRSREYQRSSHDSDGSPDKSSRKREEEEQIVLSPGPVTLKPLLQHRSSSSDDEEDDISLDFEGLVPRTSISSAGSRNSLARHLENLSESIDDMNKSRTSAGSNKSGTSAGKTRMVPVVRASNSSSTVSRGESPASSIGSPRKTISKLKTPSMGEAEPSTSSLRNGRYTRTKKNSLKLVDLHQDSCDDFDHPEHDGKTLTSRTVSTVSTSSSYDWLDFY